MHHGHGQHDSHPRPFWGSRYSIGLLVFGGIALYFLLSEHRAHFLGVLPLLLLLSCPLMHVFMHHGHGGHHGDHQHEGKGRPDPDAPAEPGSSNNGDGS
jgi:hypothetical protein